MDIDQASNFLVGTILMGIGFCIIAVIVVAINNLLHKFWKPVNLTYFAPKYMFDEPKRFATPEELQKIEPTTEPVDKKSK
jgi:hypothetical protein